MSSLVSSSNEHLKLTKFYINGIIHYHFAEFTIREWYSSSSNTSIIAKYIFPIISDIPLARLAISKNKGLSVLKIQDSENHIKSYEEAKNSAENDYTLEKLQETDMGVYDVGKISPKGCIQIESTYVCKTERTHLENYWKLTIPNSLFPFMSEELQREITISLKFSDINNPNNYIQHDGNSITLDRVCGIVTYQNIVPKIDIELTYYKPAPQEPLIIVQKDPRINRYAFHLSYKPDTNLNDLREADQTGEFIIFLDRSGSMYERIGIAIEAVILFIHSLPENCYFNIISFGSRWEKMFECSQKYNKSVADEAHRIVLQYKNNMGGTDLLKPLQNILEQERIPGNPLNVFIVTDANVWDDKVKIVNLIERHKYSARVSTIGIRTNEPYINWLARMGGGTSKQINTLEDINPAVLNSIKEALYPAFTDIRLSDPSLFDFFLPREPFSVFPDEKIEISGIFKNEKIPKSICLQFQCPRLESFKEITISINEENIFNSSSVLVLETKKYLKHCDRDLLIKKSKEYQVEGEYTSFGIKRYERKLSVEATLIPIKKEVINQVKPQVKRKNLAVKKRVTLKLASADNKTQPIALRTRSATKEANVTLQMKRGRDKEAKVVSPQKKQKNKNVKTKPSKVKREDALKFSSTEIDSEVEKIIYLQNEAGFWESSTNLSDIVNSILGYNLDISALNEKLMTALIVALLNEKCKNYRYLWHLLVDKAKTWLKRNKQKLLKLSTFHLN